MAFDNWIEICAYLGEMSNSFLAYLFKPHPVLSDIKNIEMWRQNRFNRVIVNLRVRVRPEGGARESPSSCCAILLICCYKSLYLFHFMPICDLVIQAAAPMSILKM